jgi:peptidoglycan/LPS O-acetylase OafA/YrhL
MKYRPDIDGLRAVAIIPVVLYHAGVPALSGGFVGVDVFFVISGFLITGLIQPEIAEGRFSLLTFYERRIRRIFPALFAVILACAMAATVRLPAADMLAFANSVAAAALFVSNMLFASQVGYFDAPAELKPLLHTWSLGVEEQFYLLFPALLLLFRRQSIGRVSIAVALIAAASFACSVYYVRHSPDSAFYLGPWRAWELSLGVLAAFGTLPQFRRQASRELAALVGLGLIACSAVALSRSDPFPGVNALYPCVGAFLVIQAGIGGRTVVNALLASRPFVFVGLISYSLYLWHWPLIVYLKRLLSRPLTAPEVAGVLLVSLLLAVLSWRYIERPFRLRPGQRTGSRRVFVGAATAISLSALFAFAAWHAHGWPGRPVNRLATHVRGLEDYRLGSCFLDEHQSYPDWARTAPCLVDNHAARTVLVWGDSFAAHYTPGVIEDPQARAYNFILYSAFSCPPVPGAKIPMAPACRDINGNIDRVLERYHPDAVVMAARWERYWNKSVDAAALQTTVRDLKDRGLGIVLVGQGPSFEFSNPVDYVAWTNSESAVPRDSSAINGELRSIAGYDVFFDPNGVRCPNGRCLLRERGEFLYWDDGHYSSYGSRIAGEQLVTAIQDSLSP